jgi:hypothetical protein
MEVSSQPNLPATSIPQEEIVFWCNNKEKISDYEQLSVLCGPLPCVLKVPLGKRVNLWNIGSIITAKLLAPLLHNQRSHAQILTWKPHFLTEIFYDLPNFFHANPWRNLKLGHSEFLSLCFQSRVWWSS